MATRRGGGSRNEIKWHPKSYEEAANTVARARSRTGDLGVVAATHLPAMIRQLQQVRGTAEGLTCPPPSTDPDGKYCVGLDAAGELEIQRHDDEQRVWGPAPAILSAVERRTAGLREALDELKQVLMMGDVPEDARVRVQVAHDHVREALGD